MKRSGSGVGLLALVFILLPAAVGGAAEGTVVRYASGDERVEGYLVTPAGTGPFPAVVVIHEWWGLNEQVKGEARRLAAEGYVALAVDLYRGRVTADREEAHELARGLPDDRARRDLVAAFDYLAGRREVRADRIGSIGWCMGGGFSLALAVAQPRLAASVIYYGRLVTDEGTLQQIRAPVLGLFGEADRGIPVASVRAFEGSMQKLGKVIEVHVYPGAGHAFANAESRSYQPAAAEDAGAKTVAFLARHLKAK